MVGEVLIRVSVLSLTLVVFQQASPTNVPQEGLTVLEGSVDGEAAVEYEPPAPARAYPPLQRRELSLTLDRDSYVFLHGLNGHPKNSWTSSEANGFFWPEQIVTDLPGCRVFTFGYNAAFERAPVDNTTTINAIAQTLVSRLIDKRQGANVGISHPDLRRPSNLYISSIAPSSSSLTASGAWSSNVYVPLRSAIDASSSKARRT